MLRYEKVLIAIIYTLSCSRHKSNAFLAKSFTRQRQNGLEISLLATAIDNFRISSTSIPETKPLLENSFAWKIEQALRVKFGSENIQRVIQSWSLLDQGYEHREFIVNSAKSSPESSFAYQHAPSYVPGLTCKSFWPIDDVPWVQRLKTNYKIIFEEFRSVTSDMQRLQQNGNNIWAGALSQEAGAYGEGWKTLVLMNRGMWDNANCKLFPRTAR